MLIVVWVQVVMLLVVVLQLVLIVVVLATYDPFIHKNFAGKHIFCLLSRLRYGTTKCMAIGTRPLKHKR